MEFTEIKSLLDLGGVFILAFIFFRQLSSKFDLLDGKLTKIIGLLILAIEDKVEKKKLQEVINLNGDREGSNQK